MASAAAAAWEGKMWERVIGRGANAPRMSVIVCAYFLVRASIARVFKQNGWLLAPECPPLPGSNDACRRFAENDTPLIEIVRGHFDLDAIAHDRTDAVTPHPSSRVRDDPVIIVEQDAKTPVRQDLIDQAVEGHQIFFGHTIMQPRD
jgi:hypothetical protein